MFGKNKPDLYERMSQAVPEEPRLALRVGDIESDLRKAKEELNMALNTARSVCGELQGKVAALESNLAALYAHLGLQRVKVTTTEEVLTGIHDLVTKTREEMRKAKGKQDGEKAQS
jgi:chromosome segregation ATPase